MGAAAFNSDISKWDVRRVVKMGNMFKDAISFKQELCGKAWVQSQAARKYPIFIGSSGSIPQPDTECESAPTPATSLATGMCVYVCVCVCATSNVQQRFWHCKKFLDGDITGTEQSSRVDRGHARGRRDVGDDRINKSLFACVGDVVAVYAKHDASTVVCALTNKLTNKQANKQTKKRTNRQTEDRRQRNT